MDMVFRIDLEELRPGMVLGENVFWENRLLLPKGTIAKASYVDYLACRGIKKVTVSAEQRYLDELIANPVEKLYAETYVAAGNLINQLKNGATVRAQKVYQIIESIQRTLQNGEDAVLLLTSFGGKCEYFYSHSLDVCIYCLITAKAMGLSQAETQELGAAALLHDVGKTKIPEAILQKDTKLSVDEFNIIMAHPSYGYGMVRKILDMGEGVAQAVQQHHEREDGSGYPKALKGFQIHPAARVIAIADMYDALISDKVYRKKVLPHEAAEYLLCISNTKIDAEIARTFLQHIAIYPKGCEVLLSTNEVAIVADPNPSMPLRPVVKVITDSNRNSLKQPFLLELETNHSVFVVEIFN